MAKRQTALLALILWLLAALPVSAAIYDAERDSAWLPITYVINGTFDVVQNPNWFSQRDFSGSSERLWKRVRNPFKSLDNDGGLYHFVKDEFFSTRVVPNILLHTLGGSYDALWLREYFEQRGSRYPVLMSSLFWWAARVGNEIVETSQKELSSHDHLADLFFFDIAGMALSHYPDGMNFLLDDLGMRAWHFQPMWSLKNDDFFNVGLNYVFRPKGLGFGEGWRPFLYSGMQNMLGLSKNLGAEKTLSVAAGVLFTDPLEQKGKMTTGLFYEEQKRLVASFMTGGAEGFRWRAHYNPMSRSQSWFVMIGEDSQGKLAAGLSLNLPFGLGVRD